MLAKTVELKVRGGLQKAKARVQKKANGWKKLWMMKTRIYNDMHPHTGL